MAELGKSEQPNCLGQSFSSTQGIMICLAQEMEMFVLRSWSSHMGLHEHGSVTHDSCQSGGKQSGRFPQDGLPVVAGHTTLEQRLFKSCSRCTLQPVKGMVLLLLSNSCNVQLPQPSAKHFAGFAEFAHSICAQVRLVTSGLHCAMLSPSEQQLP
jgi:hypothetical protein